MAENTLSVHPSEHQSYGRRLAISGKRNDVIFPPSYSSLETEHASSSNVETNQTDESVSKGGTVRPHEFSNRATEYSYLETNLIYERVPLVEAIRPDEFSNRTTNSGGHDDGSMSLLSMDFLSLPSDHEANPSTGASLAIGCGTRESSMYSLTSCLYPINQMVQIYNAALVGQTPYQQASHAHEEGSPPLPHTPEVDTSPHESLEQGNPSCHAPSTSSCEKQIVYRREKRYQFADMVDVNRRLETFALYQWPLASPTAIQLANANMFYQGVRQVNQQVIHDQVVCYKCGQTFRLWEPDDNPEEEHKKWYPECFQTKWADEM